MSKSVTASAREREISGLETIAEHDNVALRSNPLRSKLYCHIEDIGDEACLSANLDRALEIAGLQLSDENQALVDAFARSLETDPRCTDNEQVLKSSDLAHGVDASVEWVVDLAEDEDEDENEDEDEDEDEARSDLHFVRNWINVEEDAVLCRLGEATLGYSGEDLYGAFVEAREGEEHPVVAGDGCLLRDRDIVAKKAGSVRRAGKRLIVDAVLNIHGDLDFSVGNIDFAGTVRIGGSVPKGFSVRTTGDLEVVGTVSGAVLAVEGDLIVREGIVSQSFLRIEGSIKAVYMHDSDVRAGGDVCVRAEILRSIVRSGGDILAPRGSIIGENVSASGLVEASILGSADEPPTIVIAGASPNFADMIIYSHLELDALDQKIADIESKLGDKVDPVRISALKGPARSHYRGLYKNREKLMHCKVELREELQAVAEALGDRQGSTSCVRVRRTIHRQVQVQIGAGVPTAFKNTTQGKQVI
ncbi:MAG: DUF342 domain-containing protein [Myxococcales bacterium]|nr:DUF342 domain-containing protein [Myxococcales bacterium]